ncbi:hypothetical protein CICLE_v10013178mg [Citrus x clementina]|uniref:Uncharacterized protein n=1 Tax=Citrus clementina TaxID=85681 RepID=V4UTX4_CITCL|nr:hypothetical protein CICLE_v10013178mg [Citrus x clementina]
MKIICKTFTAFISLILICSSLSLCNEMDNITIEKGDHQKNNNIIASSRRLLVSSMASISSQAKELMISINEGGAMKESKKAVMIRRSLRKAPPSTSNPIQNKHKT